LLPFCGGSLFGGSGADSLSFGSGTNNQSLFNGGAGNDSFTFSGALTAGSIVGGTGNDVVNFAAAQIPVGATAARYWAISVIWAFYSSSRPDPTLKSEFLAIPQHGQLTLTNANFTLNQLTEICLHPQYHGITPELLSTPLFNRGKPKFAFLITGVIPTEDPASTITESGVLIEAQVWVAPKGNY